MKQFTLKGISFVLVLVISVFAGCGRQTENSGQTENSSQAEKPRHNIILERST